MKSIKEQLNILKQDSTKLDRRLQSSEQLLSQMYEALVQHPTQPIPASTEFTKAEHRQFLQAIDEQDRKNVQQIAQYIPTKTPVQIHKYASQYFMQYDKTMIEIMKQAHATDLAFKQANQKPHYMFAVQQLALASPPPLIKQIVIKHANSMFYVVCGTKIPEKDYGREIRNYIQMANSFLSYVVTSAGQYAIRSIMTVALGFWKFWEEQEFQMNNFAKIVDLHVDIVCAIVFCMMVVSCQ
ncbi:hypothetical protein SS50377_25295 [Spironucleus salmonicida]|uniref:SANT domain-containing protein n=1 Tax=Spironucleus salmonicida TaxID=348837 RepID=V6LM83_9EUKA|nr:hypothetical protein SS50377_25295 [Spironucleus salmonicida]|eukprot:EST41824.1 Hypothetical protein SS50377_18658 [Spironucleus salmonicida]